MRWWMRTRMTTQMMENKRMSWRIQTNMRTMMEEDEDKEEDEEDEEDSAMMRWAISRPLA
jgi:hypothetical protein